ncbi:MAG: hypothetical protein ACKOS8_14070 [Gemmataceae bacterium]
MRIGGFLAVCLVWIAVPSVRADLAPASPEELRQRATLIVEGVIEGLRIGREPSEFEPGIGNSDWGIDLTLRVDRVLKGQAPAGPLVARCFRVRQRRSLGESLTPSGHHPIPGVGARVTAHLNGEDDAWRVVLPNGIRVLDGPDSDAPEIQGLRSGGYTWLLPVEWWAVAGLTGGALVLAYRVIRRRRRWRNGGGTV